MAQSPEWSARTRTVARPGGSGGDVLDALRLFRQRARSEGVVTLGARTGLVYGALARALGKRVPWVAKEIFLEEADAARGGLKRSLQRWAFAACDACIVYARAELGPCADTLGLPASRCVFVPFHTRIDPVQEVQPGEGALLAAGRSQRDFAALAAAARTFGGGLDVVAPEGAREYFAGIPGVNFLGELEPADYAGRLRGSRGVVVSLLPGIRSAGQAVLLEAMALGKPALVSRSPGVADYAAEDVTCLMHSPGDAAGLARNLSRLDGDAALRARLGTAALERSREFTPDHHARAVLAVLEGVR